MPQYKYLIRNIGMGGMLAPPNHAQHSYSVKSVYRNRTEGLYSLESALNDEDVPADVKAEIKALFANHPPEFTEAWEHSCYNYFRNCYSLDGKDRNVNNSVLDLTNSLPPQYHLAVLHIQKYFPDHEPNEHLIHCYGFAGDWSPL